MRVVIAFLIKTICNFAIGLLVAKFLGPEEFGRFALALAVGVVIQAALFDWIRLAATRFYSPRVAEQEPDLRATLDLPLNAGRHVIEAAQRHHPGVDRLSARRFLGEPGNLHIPIGAEHQRARDRGCRHHQGIDAGAAFRLLGGQTQPLMHAKTMLLIDHGERQIGELDVILDEGVSADRKRRRAIGKQIGRAHV